MDRRILFTASTFSHIYHFHRPYLRAFARLGWEVDVACGGGDYPLPEAGEVVHIPLEKRMTSPRNVQAVKELRSLIRRRGYAMVSCHTSLAAFFTRAAVMGMRNRPPVVCTAHGYLFDGDTPPARRLLLSGAERLTAPVTDLLMTMNRWDTQYALRRRLGKRVVEIPGVGVEPARPPEEGEREVLRRVLGFTDNDFLMIYAAEFSKRKSQEVLIRALTRLPERAVLLLPGEGEEKDWCRALAGSLGLGGRVVFPGQIPREAGPGRDMTAWYAASDAAVSSSRSEGLPFNIMEAMGWKLPVAASDVKGNQDLIRHGENGLLYPYGDAEGCAEQMKRLLDAPEEARRMGEQGCLDSRRYRLEAVLPQVMEVYRQSFPALFPAPAAVQAPLAK